METPVVCAGGHAEQESAAREDRRAALPAPGAERAGTVPGSAESGTHGPVTEVAQQDTGSRTMEIATAGAQADLQRALGLRERVEWAKARLITSSTGGGVPTR